ncbi:MAG: phytase [bacterium]|nr:phytase [bacterium]
MKRSVLLLLISLVCALALQAQDVEIASVTAVVETAPSPGDGSTGVRAWVHPTNPAFSLILGADDNDGFGVYNLDGELLQFLDVGGVKHVDVRYNFMLGNRPISLIAAGVEDSLNVLFFTVDEDTLAVEPLGQLETGVLQNGLCMYRSPLSGRTYVIAISDDGSAEQWWLDGSSGEIAGTLARSLSIGSETEGCVVDDALRALYVAEEGIAIWRYGAEPESGTIRRIVDLGVPRGNITEEVEGLAVYLMPDGGGYLIATNQTSDAYLVYERGGDNTYIGQFEIAASDTIDQVNESAGIDVINLALGANFPEGVFIAQDDTNSAPNDNNNFKLVSWSEIAGALDLDIDTTVDVRTLGLEIDTDQPTVTAILETAPVQAGVDAADDPAIWIHPTDANQSLIIGTDKTTGLVSYNLDGSIQQRLNIGRVNNVDVRYNFMIDGVPTDLVATTNRTTNTLDIFRIDPETRQMEAVLVRPLVSAVKEVYGLCFYVSPLDSAYYVFVNSADTGEVEQYRLSAVDGGIDAEVVRTFVVGSQTEGCAADDEAGVVYIGEEAVGFWKYSAEPGIEFERIQIDNTTPEGHLTADVEGIAIYYGENGAGYILVSSQGSSEFAVYDRQGDNAYLGSFVVIEGGTADAVSGTDGIDVLNAPLGDQFPNGVFIAQDDLNIDPDDNQNFKLIDWAEIAQAMELESSTTFNPRSVGQ